MWTTCSRIGYSHHSCVVCSCLGRPHLRNEPFAGSPRTCHYIGVAAVPRTPTLKSGDPCSEKCGGSSAKDK